MVYAKPTTHREKRKKRKKKKENLPYNGLCYFGRLENKIERKRREREREREVPRPCLRNEKLWNLKVTVIPIKICALGTIPKILVKGLEDLEIRGQVETIQSTASLRSA